LQLDDKYLINNGGCCFVAYLIAFHLDRLGLRYKLLIFTNELKDDISISSEVHSKVKNNSRRTSIVGSETCCHYALYLEGGGTVNVGGFDILPNKYLVEDINSSNIKWVYRSGRWNQNYNIRNNRIIRKTFNAFFNGYEERNGLSNH
jgi:hypothetical protein